MSAPVSEGDVVLDKYRVERVLGQGGMGVVVAATHVDLDQRVALKFLLPEALAHPELVERFAREAKAAARIQSQHVVRVLDTGRMPSGAPFMVMEYLEGDDLSDVLQREGRIPPSRVVDYLLQACEAVGEAHAAGIVHRDLKPANLFLAKQRDRRSLVKVLDFGISKLEDPTSAPITRTQTMMGSPHYMSPEQLVSSKHVDARSDVWALGVILYELVSGRRPFDGETMPEVVGQILNNAPARLGTLCDDVSLDFELVVAKCLASSPDQRFASVAELARALESFAGDASAAGASVARITRVLGGASVPPPAEAPSDSRQVVLLGRPESTTAAAAPAALAASAGAASSAMANDATVHENTAGPRSHARGASAASTTAAAPGTTSSALEVAAVVVPPPKGRPRQVAVLAVGAAVLGLVGVLALRASSSRGPAMDVTREPGGGTAASGATGPARTSEGLVDAGAVPTSAVAAAVPPVTSPVNSPGAPPAVDSSSPPATVTSSPRKVAGVAPPARPSAVPASTSTVAAPTATATASSIRKSPLEMGIK